MNRGPRVIVVGGGIASLVCGIELRERLPDVEVTLLTATTEGMLGGQLASWDDRGFPVEHGLHALFGFYSTILPYVKRVGASRNLTRSKDHVFVHERGRFHRFQPSQFMTTYEGFTVAQRMSIANLLPHAADAIARSPVHGLDVLDRYDRHDLRAFCRKRGVDDAILKSDFFRQFYDGAFNEPYELSAAVGLKSMYKLFLKPWLHYFNLPTRLAIVEPFRAHFETLGGRLAFGQRLEQLVFDPHGERLTALSIRDVATGELRTEHADYYVLALGLEELRTVDLGPAWRHPYFRNIQKLTTVSSVSLQAWFKDDPVPPHCDALIVGLPEPLSIAAPISRVRSVPPQGAFPHELWACGPEAGFESTDDGELTRRFFATLSGFGFRFPSDPGARHVVVRRNREPFHRYLLTRPSELHLRPTPESPYPNLFLAGAWIRNRLPLPCVDSAAWSGRASALRIAAHANARPEAEPHHVRTAPLVARMSPLVLPPPYVFRGAVARVFVVDADAGFMRALVPVCLGPAPHLHGKALIGVIDYPHVRGLHDATGAIYRYREVVFGAFVREARRSGFEAYGLFPLTLFVDDDSALAAGREAYGFPKRMAALDVEPGRVRVVRAGLAPDSVDSRVRPIEVLSGTWTERSPSSQGRGGAAVRRALARVAQLAGAGAHLAELLRRPFYTIQSFAAARCDDPDATVLARVLRVPLENVEVHRVTPLRAARFTVSPSRQDPLDRLLAPGTSCFTADLGFCVELSFELRDATVVESDHSAASSS